METAQQIHRESTQAKEQSADKHESASHSSGLTTPPSLADQYIFQKSLGHGSQGKIYLAQRLDDQSEVVIKQLNINSIKSWKEYELFHREAAILGSLDIPGVAKFYEAIDCLSDNPPCSYIVQERIPGSSMQQMLNDGHRFEMNEVYDILIQTLQILEQLHHHQPPIVHRDIKPSNLMLTPTDDHAYRVTIIDFGAVANPQVQGGGSTVAGTYGYMPPEQLMGNPTPASDIYALAAVAVQLFTGKPPSTLPIVDFNLVFEPEMQEKPHALVTLLRQMLNPKADERLTDIQIIIQCFRNFQSGQYDILSNTSKSYQNDYEQNLENLSSIFDPGAMELWKQLSDIPPRIIPITYKRALSLNRSKSFNRNASSSFKSILKAIAGVFHLLGRLLSFFIFFFILAYIGVVLHDWTFKLTPFSAAFCIGTGIIFTLLGGIPAIMDDRKNKRNSEECIAKQNDFKLQTSDFYDLIKNGRKSIATIVDIQYAPIPDNALQIHKHKNNILIESLQKSPNFIVRYAFNPPDDMRADDIIHKFITHDIPDYEPGDIIPILYTITPHLNNDTVQSMPFPVPIQDITEGGSIIDQSDSTFQVPRFNYYGNIDPDFKTLLRELKNAPNLMELNRIINEIASFLCSKKTDEDELSILSFTMIVQAFLESNQQSIHISAFTAIYTLVKYYSRSTPCTASLTLGKQLPFLLCNQLHRALALNIPITIQLITHLTRIIERLCHSEAFQLSERDARNFSEALLEVYNHKDVSKSVKKVIHSNSSWLFYMKEIGDNEYILTVN